MPVPGIRGYTLGPLAVSAAEDRGVEQGRTIHMGHILRPASEKTFSLADALAGTPRCVLLVESALHEVIEDPADDGYRKNARDLVRSLSSGCPDCGFKEPPSILKKLLSLLAVSPAEGEALKRSYADRLLEQVALLKAHAQERRA